MPSMGLGLQLGRSGGTGAAATIDLLMVGDSIINNYPDPGFFSLALKDLIATRQASAVNLTRIGAGGASWNYDHSSTGTINALLTASINSFSSVSKVVMFAGTNGLVLGAKAPAQEFADFEVCLNLILARGVLPANIIVCTMLPRQSYSEVNRSSYNSLLITGSATYGYKIAGFHLNYEIGYSGAAGETYWYSDQIHPTVNACDQMARIVYDQLYADFFNNFQYSQLPNYWDHWDAQATATITLASSRVSSWASAGSRNLVQATGASQPLFTATGINSKNAILFDGANRRDFLKLTGFTFDCKPMASWVVLQSDDFTTTTGFIWGMHPTDSWNNNVNLASEPAAGLRFIDAINGGSALNASAMDLNPNVLGANYRIRTSALPRTSILKNGVWGSVGSFNSTTQVAATVLYVGAPVLDFWRLRGRIGEIGFCQGEVTAYWNQLLAKKLAIKWGLTAPNVP